MGGLGFYLQKWRRTKYRYSKEKFSTNDRRMLSTRIRQSRTGVRRLHRLSGNQVMLKEAVPRPAGAQPFNSNFVRVAGGPAADVYGGGRRETGRSDRPRLSTRWAGVDRFEITPMATIHGEGPSGLQALFNTSEFLSFSDPPLWRCRKIHPS
jgi:hypothetical protein